MLQRRLFSVLGRNWIGNVLIGRVPRRRTPRFATPNAPLTLRRKHRVLETGLWWDCCDQGPLRSRPPGQHHEGDAPPSGRQINSKNTRTWRSVVSKSQAAKRHLTLAQSYEYPADPIDPIEAIEAIAAASAEPSA